MKWFASDIGLTETWDEYRLRMAMVRARITGKSVGVKRFPPSKLTPEQERQNDLIWEPQRITSPQPGRTTSEERADG